MSESLLFRLVSFFDHISDNKVGRRSRSTSLALLTAVLLFFCGFTAGSVSISAQVLTPVSVEAVRDDAPATLPLQVTLPTVGLGVPNTFIVPVKVSDLTGDGIISFNFRVLYDPTIIHPSGVNFGCSTVNTLAGDAGAGATCNVLPAGTLRVSVSGAFPMTGSGTIINLTFTTDPAAMMGQISPLTFNSVAFYAGAGQVAVNTFDGSITILGPTAASASITGRVATSAGRAISFAQVVLTDDQGVSRTAISNPFGYFRFDDVETGSTYVLGATHKRYTFPSRLFSVLDNLTGVDLTAEP